MNGYKAYEELASKHGAEQPFAPWAYFPRGGGGAFLHAARGAGFEVTLVRGTWGDHVVASAESCNDYKGGAE